MKMSMFEASVDARKYEPKDKHPTIFNTLATLKSGQKMELINDHDPKPLYYQLEAEHPKEYEWEYLENGPEVWRISITKK